jgi:hypothetical protein
MRLYFQIENTSIIKQKFVNEKKNTPFAGVFNKIIRDRRSFI